MSDYLPMSGPSKSIGISGSRLKSCLIASSPYPTSKNPFSNLKRFQMKGSPGQVMWFLLNVAALDVVRRLSSTKCPPVWRAVQSLQLLNFLPFKWIHRWGPMAGLFKGLQALSKPFLFLSAVRVLLDNSRRSKCNVISSPPHSGPLNNGTDSESSATGGLSEGTPSNNWLMQLRDDLKSQGLMLPERFNDDDELHRFVIASGGNFACLQHSLKKTIRWRETYKILSLEDITMWSNLLFWHGTDVKSRPCLIIRLGLACSSSLLHSNPSFLDALVSQIDYGVANLLNKEDPTVTVLVDCQGLTPLKFPMKMLRSCALLMQEHYPNRLASLLVIRLPPVVRVLAQTFLQVLGPSTRQKLRVGGEPYQKFLSEFLHSIPSFLGGQCTCSQCTDAFTPNKNALVRRHRQSEATKDISDDDSQEHAPWVSISHPYDGNFDQVAGNTIVSFLILWIVLVVLMGIHGSGHLSLSSS